MKNKILTTLSIIAFMGGFLIIFLSGPVQQIAPTDNQVNQQPNNSQKLETKTDEQASVTVTVTPMDISPQSKEWKFDVVMDTHSVELDQNMIIVATLVADNGEEYRPLRWEGAEAGGHHREGVLIWSAIEPMPKLVEIKIKDIGGIPERSFKWDLN